MRKLFFIGILLPSLANGAGFLHIAHGPSTVNQGVTQYYHVGTTDAMEFPYATESSAQVPYHTAGKASHLWLKILGNSLSGTAVFTLRINGADTDMTITVSAGSTGEFTYTASSITVSAGDLLDMKLVTASGSGTIFIESIAFIFEADSGSMMKWVADGPPQANTNGWATYYDAMAGPLGTYQDETIGPQFMMPISGTFKNMSVRLITNTLNAAQACRFRVNATNTDIVISITANQTGLLEDTAHTVHVTTGDLVDFSYYYGNTGNSGTTDRAFESIEFVPDDPSKMIYLSQNLGHNPAWSGGTQYTPAAGAESWDIESSMQVLSNVAGVVSNLSARVQSNSTPVDLTITFRHSGSNGTNTFTVPASSAGYFSDNAHTDVIVSTDQINTSMNTPATGNAAIDYIAMVITSTSASGGGSPPTTTALSGWGSNGGYKMAQEDTYAGDASSNTITNNWDGTTWTLRSGKNETTGGIFYIINNSTSDVSNVRVSLSPLTNGADVISSTAVLCAMTTDYSTRPFQLYVSSYVQILGQTKQSWPAQDEYEERNFPERFRRPYTVNGASNQGSATGGTGWTDRVDHDKHYPDALIPHECIPTFTVTASSSQAIWLDVYASSSRVTGTYSGTLNIYTGATLSTSIPVHIEVANVTLPDAYTFPATIVLGCDDIGRRHYNDDSCTASGQDQTNAHYVQALRAHGFSSVFGLVDNSGSDSPPAQDLAQINGSLFSAASGYYNQPGANVGAPYYSIGTYASWTGWGTTNAGAFCSHVKNWGDWFQANYPSSRAFVYLKDEDLTGVDMWSTWMSTVTACQTSGYTMGRFVTSTWPSINTTAPRINMPVTTTWIDTSSTTWESLATTYCTTGSTKCWAYNGHPGWFGSNFATEDAGTSPYALFWSLKKKGVQGWMGWRANYWRDENNYHGRGDVNVFTTAQTFGTFDTTSSTLGQTSTNSDYSNGDGVLQYPGKDLIFPSSSFGIDGPIASIRLKNTRRAIRDMDYIAQAYAIDPSSTTALMARMVPTVLWERYAFDPDDPSYSYGGRSWSDDPQVWEQARQNLTTIITGAGSTPAGSSIKTFSGSVTFGGGGTFR